MIPLKNTIQINIVIFYLFGEGGVETKKYKDS
jgi:hypothetical protein